MNLSEHHVPGSKDTYYIPDFVTADEEAYLLRKVRASVLPRVAVVL
jgi:alkylated DNA repair protein alkB family protein 6